MKKTMMKQTKAAVFAVASALACATDAASWFDAGVTNYTAWPVANWSSTSEATDPVADMVTLSGEAGAVAMKVDTGKASLQYAIVPVGETNNAPLVINATQVFTPVTDVTKLIDPTGRKGGLAVVKTGEGAYAYYGVVAVNGTNTWVRLDGAPTADPATTPVSVRVTLTDGGASGWTVAYALVEGSADAETVTPLPYNAVNAPGIVVTSAVTKVVYTGRGTVAALSGTYTLVEVPIVPGGTTTVTAKSESDALEQVSISVPSEATKAGISDADYRNLFDKTATNLGDNRWSVSVVLKPSVLAAQVTDEGPATTTTEAIPVSDLAAGTAGTSLIITSGLTPGLYYSIKASSDVAFPESADATKEGPRAMANGTGGAELTYPEQPSGPAVFYRTHVDAASGK